MSALEDCIENKRDDWDYGFEAKKACAKVADAAVAELKEFMDELEAKDKRIAELEAALTQIANATWSSCEGERWMKSIASDALKGEE